MRLNPEWSELQRLREENELRLAQTKAMQRYAQDMVEAGNNWRLRCESYERSMEAMSQAAFGIGSDCHREQRAKIIWRILAVVGWTLAIVMLAKG